MLIDNGKVILEESASAQIFNDRHISTVEECFGEKS